jgi:hypothetical protein
MYYLTFREDSTLWEATFSLKRCSNEIRMYEFSEVKSHERHDGPPSHFTTLCVNDDGLESLPTKRNN